MPVGLQEDVDGTGQAILATQLLGTALAELAQRFVDLGPVVGQLAEGTRGHDALAWLVGVIHLDAGNATQLQSGVLQGHREAPANLLGLGLREVPGRADPHQSQPLHQPAAYTPDVTQIGMPQQVLHLGAIHR